MKQIYLYTNDQSFFIKSNNFEFENLRIQHNGVTHHFDHVEENTWKLDATLLQSLLQPETEERVFIYYGSENKQIFAKEFQILSSSSLFLSVNNQDIYFYISLDHYLRFMQKQKPTAKIYLDQSEILNIDTLDINTIQMTLRITSNFFKLNNLNFIISNRKENFEEIFEFNSISSEYVGDNLFENIFKITFEPKKEFTKLKSRFDYFDYDTSIFDFWFTIDIKEFPLTELRFRIPYSDTIPYESWCEFNQENMISVNWYATGYGNISSRIVVLNKDVYKYYLDVTNDAQKNTLQKPERPIVLVTEYPYKAQDNGLIFFKFLYEQQNDFDPYYVISENSPDLTNLDGYMDKVLFYKSTEHIKTFYEAEYIAHTHTPNYALPFLSKNNEDHRNTMKKLFLQHGIIGVRNLEYIYGRKTHPLLIDKFIASSQREVNIIRDELFYPESDIILSGLARFDKLLERNSTRVSKSLKNKILIMPTWRQGLELLSDEEFIKTDFYKEFNNLINDDEFRKLAQKKKLEVNLYLHNNFQKYNHLFVSNFVKIIVADSITVQNLLKTHGILVTDYSSVGLDFALQKRAVLYFQFESQLKEQRDENEEELTFLPGKVFHDKESLLKEIKHKVRNNKIDRKFRKNLKKNLYKFMDQNACNRIFKALKTMQET